MLWWALLLCISPAASAWTLPARFPTHRLLPPRGAARARALLSRWSAAPAPPAGSRVYLPLDYGADPLGLHKNTRLGYIQRLRIQVCVDYLSLAPVSQSSCLALVDRLAGPVSIEEKALLIL